MHSENPNDHGRLSLAGYLAHAETSARELLKRLKAAHQSGVSGIYHDVRLIDELVIRLGAKRRWLLKKSTRPSSQPHPH